MRTVNSGDVAGGLRRDLELLWRIASMVVQYWIAGGRLRREYRRREARGEVLWLDALGTTEHREAPMQRTP